MKHASHKRYSHYGPGGRNCPCCGPAPVERTRHDRAARRREKMASRQDIRQEILAMREEAKLA